MKIYFSGSIRGSKPKENWFQKLINFLSKYGQVLTKHSFDYSYDEEIKFKDNLIWKRDLEWLNDADVVIAEVSAPSLGVGYEIGKAEEWGKPILCLYRIGEKKLSAMIEGSLKLTLRKFNHDHQALEFINEFFKELKT